MSCRSDVRVSRRVALQVGTSSAIAAITTPRFVHGAEPKVAGFVVGEPTAEKVGQKVLADGGNAIDAIVAGALAAAVAAPHQTGLGGYGAHGIFAVGGNRIVALDANTIAPAAMRADTFKPDANGDVPDRINEFGWLAAGVPGILAGLQLALDQFGTLKFGDLCQPAVALARDGIRWPASLTNVIQTGAARFAGDPGSRSLYFSDGKPIAAGTIFRNPRLAEMLESLGRANSVDAFYRGDIAGQIADSHQKSGGLLEKKDLADYQAKLVDPIRLQCDEYEILTAPLTAGGLTVLQAIHTLQAMRWSKVPAAAQSHARIEALRLAWRDRLALLGDPEFAAVPQSKLLSADYARECAARIEQSVKSGKLLAHAVRTRPHGGTIHLSAADGKGNFAALTLTHGNSFGARVTVPGLGLTLGHGMSRFDPRPDHPNAPGPRKKPLHNMCPTIVKRQDKPVLAVGGRGGRKIPNALFEFLVQYALLKQPLAKAIAAPRLHTEGTTNIELEGTWPLEDKRSLESLGYAIKTAGSATLSAVGLEESELRRAMR